MHSAHRFRVLATVATVVTLACGGARKKDTAGGEAGRQLALESIYDRLMTMSPTAAVALGYHEFDGRLPAIGQADLEAQINSLRLMEQQLKSPVPGRELDQQILLAEIRGRRFQLEVMARPWRDPLFYLSKLGIDDYVSRPYASAVVRSQAIIRLARATPGFLMAAERNLSKPMPRTYVQTGLLVARGLISFANDDARKQLGSLPPAKRKALDQALGEYTSALEAHARFLEDKLERANDDFRLGKESFLRMLEMTEGLTISLEDLQSIATSDLERNRQALIDAALELAPDATTAQAVEQVRRDRPTPSELLSQA
ncbi:MAG: DUF885 family protein, partial [Deltaproteobacteria bacterium]|nr:DUF885 family protein [Deltaproteobacteria bacterium]